MPLANRFSYIQIFIPSVFRNDSKRDLAENFAAFERFKLYPRSSTGAGVGIVDGGSPAIKSVVNSPRSPMFHFGTAGTTTLGRASPTLNEVPSTPNFILRKPQLPPITNNKGSNPHLQRPPSGCQVGISNLLNTGQRPSNDGVSVKV